MNILVTGAAGFIGHHLCCALSSKNHVFGLYHDTPPRSVVWHPIRRDVTDRDAMLGVIVDREIDQVYHCAAKSIVRNCCRDPIGCLQVNVIGTASLLEACRLSKRVQGIMCMESDKSYGAGPTPYKEGQALEPSGIYEASKACAGLVAKSYHDNFQLPVFTIRSANVYGPGDPNKSRLVPRTISRIKQGKQPQVTAGAENFLREFIYIYNLLEAMISLMEVAPWGEAINVGSGYTMTVPQLIACICDEMGISCQSESWEEPGDLLEIPSQSLCLDKLHRLIPDLTEPFSISEGIRKTVACST